MVRVNVTDLSYVGTWADGYVPELKEMKELARLHRNVEGSYGFSQLSDIWTPTDYFVSLATALRDMYDRDNMPEDSHPTPCFMWLAQIDRRPTDPQILPIYEECIADQRSKNYYHFITIHPECPIEKDCFENVMKKLHFESKSESIYLDKARFVKAVENVLSRYVNFIAAPQQQIKDHLKLLSQNVYFQFT